MARYFFLLAGLALASCSDSPPRHIADTPPAPDAGVRSVPPLQAQACPTAGPDFGEQFADAARMIAPAVVAISSSGLAGPGEALAGTPFAPFLRGLPLQTRTAPQTRGIGSGVILDDQGNILTNHHVVEGTDSVRVQLAEGPEVNAKVVGSDPKTDVAVIRIDPKTPNLRAAPLSDSTKLRIGTWVMASGRAFGHGQTVSVGILSSIGRGSAGIAEYEDFIQTDARIDAVNSGGPLVDRAGQVIGINTAIGASGEDKPVSFAIPIDMARKVAEQLIEAGKVVRGTIGAYVAYLSEDLARSFGYHDQGGALVQDVAADSPAARAGLAPGDIIVERAGDPVENATAFRNAISNAKPGTSTQLALFRNGKRRNVEVEIGELEAVTPSVVPGGGGSGQLVWGLEFADVTPELRERLGLKKLAKGALIVQVNPSSPADDAGLRAGDLVASIGKTEVLDADQARRAMLTAKAPVRLRVVHDGRGVFVMLRRED